MKHFLDHHDFVHSDFPEPMDHCKGMKVQFWDDGYAMELIKKYWPSLYNKLTINVDFEV